MKVRKSYLLFSVIGIAVLIGFSLYAQRAVLIHFKDPTAIDPGDGLFVVFNPFRDRQPEMIASSFLEVLKKGDCSKVQEFLQDKKFAINLCNDENEHQLVSWEIANREDQVDGITIHFKAKRKGYPENVYGNVWVTVKRQGTKWSIENYLAWY